MSVRIIRRLFCDSLGCPSMFDGDLDQTNVEVRRAAKRAGWSKLSGGPATDWKPRDFCPGHPRGGAS